MIAMLNRLIGSAFLILSLILLFHQPMFGQAQAEALPQLSGPETPFADSLFRIGQMDRAIDEYKKLVAQNPKEASYHHKLGVAYLYGTPNTTEAIRHLSYTSDGSLPNVLNYYLGYAHQLSYNFEKAIEYYRSVSPQEDIFSLSLEHIEILIGQCENGLFMLKYIYQPKVIDKKRIGTNEVFQYVVTQSDKGSFVPKPKDLLTKIDKERQVSDYIFFPKNPKAGDKVVYSSYGSSATNEKDLYMIEMLRNGLWSKPQNLGDVVNTRFDEDFPYLAPDGVTLYFASKGHYSMGGYDIYRALYNSSTNQWSIPENLGFPFSSPLDELLFVPNQDETLATFVTNRHTCADSIDVVLVELDQNPIRRTISSLETIREISLLDVVQSTKGGNLSANNQAVNQTTKAKTPNPTSFSDVENDPEYLRSLAMGFKEQLKADSLRSNLEALREKFDFVTTAVQRVNLERQVVAVEDSLLKAQRNADLHFVNASKIEQEYLVGKRKPKSDTQSTIAVDNPTFLYQAQYAHTVFRQDELTQLEKVEKLLPKLDRQREELKKELGEFNSSLTGDDQSDQLLPAQLLTNMGAFNRAMREHIYPKKGLYSDCISVALMKSGTKGNEEVKREVDAAKAHFRSATTIRNNADADHAVESEYDAIRLDELGVLRLEIAFAKLWGIRMFEQQTLSKALKLERNIFGAASNSHMGQIAKTTDHVLAQQALATEAPTILRVEVDRAVEGEITFEPETNSSFQVTAQGSIYNAAKDIPSHMPLPQGVIYRIQLAAYSKPIDISVFKGMSPLWAEPINDGKITKYYVGNFRLLHEAEKAQMVVREKGFKDAFIVAWHNGRSVQTARAKQLEQSEPIPEQPIKVSINMEQEDNTLYIISLGEFSGALPTDIAQTVRTLAPGKDIVRKPNPRGGFTYTVGSYGNVTEAQRVKDNLVASGLKEAVLIAVETDN